MAETERVGIRLYRGGYERTPQADELGLSDNQFQRGSESHTYAIADVGPADVLLTSTELWVAGVGVISAAITGAFAYLAKGKGGEIYIKGTGGRSIKVPKGTSHEDIDFYIKKAKEIDVEHILISESAN